MQYVYKTYYEETIKTNFNWIQIKNEALCFNTVFITNDLKITNDKFKF